MDSTSHSHNKLDLAGELLLEAASVYETADKDADYAKSILLAGAVLGIVSPYIEELGHTSSQRALAQQIKSSQHEFKKTQKNSISFFRYVYNSLKHAGDSKVSPSDDLLLFANLREEASTMLGWAKDDFCKIPFSTEYVNKELPEDLLTVLQTIQS